MYANLLTASPVTQHLFRQIISQPGNKNGNDLRRSVFNQFSNARLRRQVCIRIRPLVASAFRMKTNNVTGAVSANLRQNSKGILIKRAFFQERLFTRRKERG